MTVEEAAKELGCSADMVYKLCRERQLDHYRIGRLIKIDRSHVVKYLAKHEVPAVDEPQEMNAARASRQSPSFIPDYVPRKDRPRRTKAHRHLG